MSNRETSLVPSEEFVWHLCYSHYLYPAFEVVWDLKLRERLSARKQSIEKIAEDVGTTTDALIALLPALEYFGLATSHASRRLSKSTGGVEALYSRWSPMFDRHLHTDLHVRRMRAKFADAAKGDASTFWSRTLGSPSRRRRVLSAIDAHSHATSLRIADALAQTTVHSWVDVGCGYGANSRAAMARVRGFRATMLDLPPVVRDISANHHWGARFRSRMDLVPCDATSTPWPTDRPIYFLSHFLQDFGIVQRLNVLRNARQAMNSASELWIHGLFPDQNESQAAHAAFGFYLFCNLGGGIISAQNQTAECTHAGLRLVKTVATSGLHKLLIFRKTET